MGALHKEVCAILIILHPGNKEDEFLNSNFKRFAAVISLSLIATIAIIPCAAFFVSAQTTSPVVVSSTEATEEILNESTFKANQILADKSSAETVLRAQAFDAAKKNTEETLADIEETEAAEAEKQAQQAAKTPVETVKKPAAATSAPATGGKYLLNISNPDPKYVSYSVTLDAYDRDILGRLVMGEAGAEGYLGAALVAQAIRDTMIADGYPTVESVRTSCGYYGSLHMAPNQDVLDAIEFIFDEGGAVVQHRILYFYAPNLCVSGWHESQEFVVEHNSHRFFDRW